MVADKQVQFSEANKEAEQTVVMVRLSDENHPDVTADEGKAKLLGDDSESP